MNYKLYSTIILLCAHMQSSAMLMKLTRATRPGLPTTFIRHCHVAHVTELNRKLAQLRLDLSVSQSERQVCQKACQSPFRSLSNMNSYCHSIIEVYDKKILTLQSRIKDLEKQRQTPQPGSSKSNLQTTLAQLECKIVALCNQRQELRTALQSSPSSERYGYDKKMQQCTQQITSLKSQIETITGS